MKIKKIRPKFRFFDKNRKKKDSSCVFVLCFTVSSPLEPFGLLFYRCLRFWVVLTIRNKRRLASLMATSLRGRC